ncbi:bifunctional 3-(3-hydroxy-phenyl)propionate/3-hydroxycinnamic acid hydroxylase [Mycolicibacterium aichiense]|uniref:3-(3-hydroxyphenyl)propionate hydroxylase n=1 Tax=Mycolicibacterium aichiense TaxID=1799 RepID=A0AAD1HKZ7_9MYCO|nr:bifunctional 3-(3-hydroxy-phenyl)propionate/3-hydroxycinnamic acid hydroxylase [Mycolicibacterium aichiense]MCV7019787.1 bifunctional 3-(3-hydroxy-phenyl)propionate/3-hydroxycinnamic acid hydroxylase [Mycolicibacterium aichiense]BBX06839.1 3-(3-hydroxyphenyl)propionate hydroxylase [Mycolicibacterium aichiense]STZ80655.1 3-(3-hydroxyphenyl)propionate hydroxylase [Mycolicibacterium aichiense]
MTAIPAFVPVVIVGAGPTGVSAATALAQYGIDCLVLERWTEVYPQPRAVHLDDEVFRLLAGLGVGEQFAEISRPARGLQLRDPGMRVLAEFRRENTLSANGYPQANMFDQPELERLLRDNLEKYPNAVLRGDAEVVEVVQISAERARVTFTDRSSGEQHCVETGYVLGCDGANSLVRRAIGAQMDDLKFQQRWLVADVMTDADLAQWDGVHQVCDPGRAATYMRIGTARYRWEFRLLDDETADDYATLAALYPLIRPWVDGVDPEELDLVRVAEYTFRAQIATRWRRANMFILGDAAHLTPPFIGQGLGAGLRDAMNLSWKLAGVINGWLPGAVLDSYEDERKPHARNLIRFALGVGAAMTAGGRVGDALRRIVVPGMHLIPGVRDKAVDSATPGLRASDLVVKSSGRRQLAGGLCPNPIVADGKRFDEIVGRRFAVVTAVPLSTVQRDHMDRCGATVIAAHPGTELASWLRAGRAAVAAVRPDRTVMMAGRNVANVLDAVPAFAPHAQAARV